MDAAQGPSAGLVGASRRQVALAAALALLGVAGSLWLSLGMGLKACPLCFYQRSFSMAALGALVLAGISRDGGARALAVLVAAMSALAGLGVAAFHVSLELRGMLECPKGLGEIGTSPQQSLAYFVVLSAVLVRIVAGLTGPDRRRTVGTAVVLGLAFATASVASAPPLPPRPTKPYADPLTICRPPYEAP